MIFPVFAVIAKFSNRRYWTESTKSPRKPYANDVMSAVSKNEMENLLDDLNSIELSKKSQLKVTAKD